MKERPTINAFEFFRDWQRENAVSPIERQNIVQKLVASKPHPWRYENEIRFIHSDILEQTFPYPKEVIKRVIVSKNSGEENLELVKDALRELGIQTYSEARLSDEKYAITVEDGKPL
jgi:hypothetical protein